MLQRIFSKKCVHSRMIMKKNSKESGRCTLAFVYELAHALSYDMPADRDMEEEEKWTHEWNLCPVRV